MFKPPAARGPHRQQSLLSRGSSLPQLSTARRWSSHDHETGGNSTPRETIEMANTLGRLASDAPESSAGSIRVELSPDSYGPLEDTILEQPLHTTLDVMPEETDQQVCILRHTLLTS